MNEAGSKVIFDSVFFLSLFGLFGNITVLFR